MFEFKLYQQTYRLDILHQSHNIQQPIVLQLTKMKKNFIARLKEYDAYTSAIASDRHRSKLHKKIYNYACEDKQNYNPNVLKQKISKQAKSVENKQEYKNNQLNRQEMNRQLNNQVNNQVNKQANKQVNNYSNNTLKREYLQNLSINIDAKRVPGQIIVHLPKQIAMLGQCNKNTLVNQYDNEYDAIQVRLEELSKIRNNLHTVNEQVDAKMKNQIHKCSTYFSRMYQIVHELEVQAEQHIRSVFMQSKQQITNKSKQINQKIQQLTVALKDLYNGNNINNGDNRNKYPINTYKITEQIQIGLVQLYYDQQICNSMKQCIKKYSLLHLNQHSDAIDKKQLEEADNKVAQSDTNNLNKRNSSYANSNDMFCEEEIGLSLSRNNNKAGIDALNISFEKDEDYIISSNPIFPIIEQECIAASSPAFYKPF